MAYIYYHKIIRCTLVTHTSPSLLHTHVHALIAAMQGADMLIRSDTALPIQQPTVFLSPAIHTHSRTDGTAIGSNLGFSVLHRDTWMCSRSTDQPLSRRPVQPPDPKSPQYYLLHNVRHRISLLLLTQTAP